MEKELLGFMDFQLYVDSAEWLHFYNGLYLAIHERFAITDLLFA